MSDLVGRVAGEQQRNIAVDAYRGFVMLLMMGEVLRFAHAAAAYPGSTIWRFLAYNQTHVEWSGMSLHDTIQPGFTFLVGVALPYSLRSRQRKGESFRRMLAHTMWRSLVLIALGIFLRSTAESRSHISRLKTRSRRSAWATRLRFCSRLPGHAGNGFRLRRILFGYWLAWALYPAPGANFDWAAVGVPADWHQHLYTGFAAHWNKNSNLGQAFDVWFLNLFPRTSRFLYNGGGYLTLSFIPTLGTMLLGLAAGRWFQESAPKIPLRKFLIAGAALCAAGLLLHFTGNLPDRQAHLDALMDALERRRVFPVPGRVLVGHRCEETSQDRVSAGRGGHELDCGLCHCGVVAGLCREQLSHSSGDRRAQLTGAGAGADIARRSDVDRLLACTLLDVQEEDFCAHLGDSTFDKESGTYEDV